MTSPGWAYGEAAAGVGAALVEEPLHGLAHVGDVGRAEPLVHAGAAHGHRPRVGARRALGRHEVEPEAAVGRVGAEDVVRQEAGERPAAQAEGLQDQVHVLADERALDVQRGQDAQLQVEERHLRAPEASALHPPLQPARPSRQLVDDREAVPLVEVDEQEREVLDGGVGHRDEEARPGLVDVPRVEREQARARRGAGRPSPPPGSGARRGTGGPSRRPPRPARRRDGAGPRPPAARARAGARRAAPRRS